MGARVMRNGFLTAGFLRSNGSDYTHTILGGVNTPFIFTFVKAKSTYCRFLETSWRIAENLNSSSSNLCRRTLSVHWFSATTALPLYPLNINGTFNSTISPFLSMAFPKLGELAMRSHKAVLFNFCICTTKRYGANPYYALPTRLGTNSLPFGGRFGLNHRQSPCV